MHTEVFKNIDLLIDMANSPLNIEDINLELISLRRQIKNKQMEIDDLKNIMTDHRYFNASNELVDKNIEISLKNKINNLNRQIKELNGVIEDLKKQENKLHDYIVSLKDKLDKNELYVDTLRGKASSAKANNYYSDLLEKEENNVLLLTTELKEKEARHNAILKELENSNNVCEDLTRKLDNERNRLNDVVENLSNPNAYIDTELKGLDEEKLAHLTKEIETLEKRKVELLTDPNMVGTDAKELVASNDIFEAINKIRELVSIVKSKPYMDISSPSILEEELEKKEAIRSELANLIDNKNYEEIDTNLVEKRLAYLKKEIEVNNGEIASLNKKIDDTDEFVNSTLGVNINELENEILKLEKGISEYSIILKEKKGISLRDKANLEGNISKKEEEKRILNEVLDTYKSDLLSKINYTRVLKELIANFEETNDNYNREIEDLEKISVEDFKTKDYVEEEKDKDKLKEINEEIKCIKNRQKYDRTPDEVFDQIDMLLESYKPLVKETKKEKKETKKHNIVDIIEAEAIDKLDDDIKNKELIKVVEVIPVDTTKKDTVGDL
ncbi:MAG: hypothetical protein NC483_01565 [Ruminococcus sp.]|nr:hypothetical protein [Ruminococcus sp.]